MRDKLFFIALWIVSSFYSLFSENAFSAVHLKPSKTVSHKKSTKDYKKECKQWIEKFEKKYNLPKGLLMVIAKVESGFHPWMVNRLWKSVAFPTREAAVKHLHDLKKQGITDVNVGYMQVNLKSHGKDFKTINHAMEPKDNIEHAARELSRLYKRYRSWSRAIKWYNGSSIREKYLAKVLRLLGRPL